MTDEEWAEVRGAGPVPAWLEATAGARKDTATRKWSTRCATWLTTEPALPADYPVWRAVYDFFRRWRPDVERLLSTE
jgi:hypothetical protein